MPRIEQQEEEVTDEQVYDPNQTLPGAGTIASWEQDGLITGNEADLIYHGKTV